MNNDLKYEVIIYWSEDDQAFIAEAPELAGCAADGATYSEALANIQMIISEWIETAKELGRPIPGAERTLNVCLACLSDAKFASFAIAPDCK